MSSPNFGVLDAIQVALQQVKENLQWGEDLDGIGIRLETILQSILWIQPSFMPSTHFTTLVSSVSDHR